MRLVYLTQVLILLIGGLSLNFACLVLEDHGIEGEVFPIKEKDIRQVLLKRWRVHIRELRREFKEKIEKYHEKDAGFSYTAEYKEYTCTPEYTLPDAIRDKNGRVVYPKGYTFNPLDYMTFPFEICFVSDRDIEALPKIDKNKKVYLPRELWKGRIYVLVKGNAWKLRQEGYIVWDYGLSKKWIERMCVKEVPACVKQIGSQFHIRTGYQALLMR